MGCYLSHKLPCDSSGRNIFRVYNVNDLGAELNAGKIEVTDSDLILYQKGKEPILWPLRSLRRYGFDEELFSFESGRRCPTGPGIYAFKCRRAEQLFNLVQESIQNFGQHGHIRTSQTLTNGGTSRQSSRPASFIDSHEINALFTSGNGHVALVPHNDQHLYMNGSAVPDTNYMNTGQNRAETQRPSESPDLATALIDFLHDPPPAPPPPINEMVNYADLDLPRSTENIFEEVRSACSPNVPNNGSDLLDLDLDEGLPAVEPDEVALHYADLDVFTDNPGEVTHQPTYINIGAEGGNKDKTEPKIASKSETYTQENGNSLLRVRKPSFEQNYANVNAGSVMVDLSPSPVNESVATCIVPSPVNGTPAPVSAAPAPASNMKRQSDPGELNYIEIDVNKTEADSAPVAVMATAAVAPMTYPVPDSPSKRTESYAMIDFNRTVALSNSAKPVSDDGEGLRKTRHNSTIN